MRGVEKAAISASSDCLTEHEVNFEYFKVQVEGEHE